MRTVKDYLLEAKFITELAQKLSYISLYNQDKKIVSEVKNIYERLKFVEKEIIKLLFKIKIKDSERIVMIEFIDQLKDVCNIYYQMCDLVNVEHYPRVISESLTSDKEILSLNTVKKESFLDGVSVEKKRLEEITRSRIIALKRRNKWTNLLKDSSKFVEGDVILASGTSESSELLKEACTRKNISL